MGQLQAVWESLAAADVQNVSDPVKALLLNGVGVAVRSARNAKDRHGDAQVFTEFEALLAHISEAVGSKSKLTVTQAKISLRWYGDAGHQLATRLSRRSTVRNGVGHPDPTLLHDVVRLVQQDGANGTPDVGGTSDPTKMSDTEPGKDAFSSGYGGNNGGDEMHSGLSDAATSKYGSTGSEVISCPISGCGHGQGFCDDDGKSSEENCKHDDDLKGKNADIIQLQKKIEELEAQLSDFSRPSNFTKLAKVLNSNENELSPALAFLKDMIAELEDDAMEDEEDQFCCAKSETNLFGSDMQQFAKKKLPRPKKGRQPTPSR